MNHTLTGRVVRWTVTCRRWTLGALLVVVATAVSGCDAECVDTEGATFELGFTPSRDTALEWSPLVPEAVLPLEFGSQSSWMVVFAIRTDLFEADAIIELDGDLTTDDGEVLSWVRGERARIQIGDDGLGYAIHQRMVLGDGDPFTGVFPWDGTAVTYSVRLDAGCGQVLEDGAHVLLELPKPPTAPTEAP